MLVIFLNNSLENLLTDGYYICNRCKAGIKRKHEHIASFIENIENVLFANEDIFFKSYDDYLNSIDEMGKWYVDHIATYQREISDNATKKALEYYNRGKITKRGNLYCYECEYLKNCSGEYTKAGDDCVRFLFSCLNNMDKDFVYMLSKLSKYKWSSISSALLNGHKDEFRYAMTNLGFEIYDIKPEKIDLNGDGYFDFEIMPINNVFKLRKGDILSRNGHIHIYLSDDENFGWGKVNNVYPQKTKTYIDTTTYNIICSEETFNRVYRYIGEN